ncbi:unnamed protein product [Jaminaea pallidilutea]
MSFHLAASNPPPQINAPSTYVSPGGSSPQESLCDICLRRIALCIYLKAVMSGEQRHLDTVLFTERDLKAVYEPERMRKRSYRHYVLGVLLSTLVESSVGLYELLKGISAACNEVDSLPEQAGSVAGAGGNGASSSGSASLAWALGEKRSMRNLFGTKSKSQKKGGTFSDLLPPEGLSTGPSPSGATTSSTLGQPGAFGDGGAIPPVLPFTLDFMQTFFTLCDVVVEVYSKMYVLLGGSPYGQAGANKPSASGSLLQAPSLSQKSASSTARDSSSTSSLHPPESDVVPITNALLDMVGKADNKIKKVLHQVLKELDSIARHIVKEELASFETSLTSSGSGSLHSPNDDANGAAPSAAGPTSPYTGFPGPPTSSAWGAGD